MSGNIIFNLLEDDPTQLTLHEDIINYLSDQNALDDAEEEGFLKPGASFTEDNIRDILEELIQRYETTHDAKAKYAAQQKAHNQRELFDLRKIIPDFEIDDETYEALTFRENLIIYTFDPDNLDESRPIGGLCLDIQKASGCPPIQRKSMNIEERIQNILNEDGSDTIISDDHEGSGGGDLEAERKRACGKFLVHVSSDFDVNGCSAGSRITAWVDRNVHTLEELRKEFLSQDSEFVRLLEKTLYCGLLKKCYYVKHTSASSSLEDRKFYSTRKAANFVSEGANFLLQRYLAVKNFVGTFELSAMYINGDMCRNLYECMGTEKMSINNKDMTVYRINRNVIEECGLEHRCATILSTCGQLLRQNWEGINYALRVNPMAMIKDEKPTGNEQILFKHAWEHDMQLVSKYLDEKTRNTMKIESYMLDHPELKTMVSDYVHSILLMKPEDIIEFTANHFLSFAPQYIQHENYFN